LFSESTGCREVKNMSGSDCTCKDVGNCEGCGGGSNSNGYDPNDVGYDQCADDPKSTCCDLDIEDNVWVEGVVDLSANPQKRGICMLDTMSEDQIIYTLRHDPRARCDLPKVTSCSEILELLKK